MEAVLLLVFVAGDKPTEAAVKEFEAPGPVGGGRG